MLVNSRIARLESACEEVSQTDTIGRYAYHKIVGARISSSER